MRGPQKEAAMCPEAFHSALIAILSKSCLSRIGNLSVFVWLHLMTRAWPGITWFIGMTSRISRHLPLTDGHVASSASDSPAGIAAFDTASPRRTD